MAEHGDLAFEWRKSKSSSVTVNLQLVSNDKV